VTATLSVEAVQLSVRLVCVTLLVWTFVGGVGACVSPGHVFVLFVIVALAEWFPAASKASTARV
jgi:hypothetical protein